MFAFVYLAYFPTNRSDFFRRKVDFAQLCATAHRDPAWRLRFLAQCQKNENHNTADIAAIFAR